MSDRNPARHLTLVPEYTPPEIEYIETRYTSCGDVVKTPLRNPDDEKFAVKAGYCAICLAQD